MTELIMEKIQNLEHPDVQELLKRFEDRHEMNIVDVAEIVYKLISKLKLDYTAGRPKQHSISGEHLGQVLNVGKGVISQLMSVWNMPEESKNYLKGYNLSLINAYYVSRLKGNAPKIDGEDEEKYKEKIRILTIGAQKEAIFNKSVNTSINTVGKKIDILMHAINETQMVLNGIISSYKVPPEIFKSFVMPEPESKKYEFIAEKAKTYIYNINQCINYVSPRVTKLTYLRKEIDFCNAMIDHNEIRFCGAEINKECLEKQIKYVTNEIELIALEYKLPHISSLVMMRNNLEKQINPV